MSIVQVAGGVGVLGLGHLLPMAEESGKKNRRTRAWDESAVDIKEHGAYMIG
ncbi:hypothetical protein ACFWWC_42825 [Streptomyces sp. NPDC058642]|uniref:hypothetical protein n=1 Tax=Streptomyces sp. NPDC058642 TaxID=3346572 RepID=UPI003654B4AC